MVLGTSKGGRGRLRQPVNLRVVWVAGAESIVMSALCTVRQVVVRGGQECLCIEGGGERARLIADQTEYISSGLYENQIHVPPGTTSDATTPTLRSARARREGGRATHPGGKAGHCRAPSPPMASMPSRGSTLAFDTRMVSQGRSRRSGRTHKKATADRKLT